MQRLTCVALGLVLAASLGTGYTPAAQLPTQRRHASSFSLTSSAFAPGKAIPARYTCDGAGTSPPLSWRGAPRHTIVFALIVDDPDAPGGVFTHWVLFDLPDKTHALRAGQPKGDRLSSGAIQGRNDFGAVGYSGPCPPSGPAHHYRFTLYALRGALHLAPGASKQQVLNAMRGHTLARAQLVGRYKRKTG